MDLPTLIKTNFPGENSKIREILQQIDSKGTFDTIEIKLFEPCYNSPKKETEKKGYAAISIEFLYQGQSKGGEVGYIQNEYLLEVMKEELVYIYGCGKNKVKFDFDISEVDEFPSRLIPELDLN